MMVNTWCVLMRLYFLNAVIVDCTAGSCINLQYCTLGLSKRVVCIYYTGTISYVAHHSIGDLRLQCFHFPRIFSWHAPFFLCSFTWALIPVPRNFSDYPDLSNLGITVLWYFFIGFLCYLAWLFNLPFRLFYWPENSDHSFKDKQTELYGTLQKAHALSWWKSLLLYKADIHIVLFTKLCFQLQLTSARRWLQILNGLTTCEEFQLINENALPWSLEQRKKNFGTGATVLHAKSRFAWWSSRVAFQHFLASI